VSFASSQQKIAPQAAKLLNFSFYEVIAIKANKRVFSFVADTLFKLIDAQKLQAISSDVFSDLFDTFFGAY